MKGFVYVICNKGMPGLCKIGYTLKDPTLRAEELANTGSPYPYEVVYSALVDSPKIVEQRAHKKLLHDRVGKEWFRSEIKDCVLAIKESSKLIYYQNSAEFLPIKQIETEIKHRKIESENKNKINLKIEKLIDDYNLEIDLYVMMIKEKVTKIQIKYEEGAIFTSAKFIIGMILLLILGYAAVNNAVMTKIFLFYCAVFGIFIFINDNSIIRDEKCTNEIKELHASHDVIFQKEKTETILKNIQAYTPPIFGVHLFQGYYQLDKNKMMQKIHKSQITIPNNRVQQISDSTIKKIRNNLRKSCYSEQDWLDFEAQIKASKKNVNKDECCKIIQNSETEIQKVEKSEESKKIMKSLYTEQDWLDFEAEIKGKSHKI